MSEWWQQILRFREVGGTTLVETPWYRETFVPASQIDGGDRGLFMSVETDLLGETTVRFACANGFAQYRVVERMPEVWDTNHVYGWREPVCRLRLMKARKIK